MKLIRIIGVDPGCEWLLPFAKKKLAQLAAAHGGFAAVNTLHVDGIDIRLQTYDAESGSIRIQGSQAGYRFFTTGPQLQTVTDSVSVLYRGHAVKVSYDAALDRLKGSPLGSSLREDTNDPKRWQFFSNPEDISGVLHHLWQVEGIIEHAHYSDSNELLVTPWGADRDQSGLSRHSAINGPRESLDRGYDAPPTTFRQGRSVQPPKVPDMDWYRRGALRTVTHPVFGSRKFIVMSDVSHGFAAYPMSAPVDVPPFADVQQIKTTITDTNVKRFTPTLPPWVELGVAQARDGFVFDEPPDRTMLDHPQTLWKFNSTGTRCAALLKHTLPAVPFPTTSFTDGFGTHTFPGAGTVPEFSFNAEVPPVDIQDRDSLPGFVEYNIGIELTGPELKDFTFTMGLRSEEDPRTSNNYPIAIDYAWDIGKPLLQERDDLMVLYGEVWHSCTGWADRYHDYSVQFLLKNLSKGITAFAIRGEGLVITGHKYADAGEPETNALWERQSLARPFPGVLAHDVLCMNIAALDLRFGGFVLERRLVRKSESTEQRICAVEESAVKIEVYAWGELQEEQWLTTNGVLNARLDELNALDPTTALTYTKYPTMTVGDSCWTPVVGSETAMYEQYYHPTYGMIDGFLERFYLRTVMLGQNPETQIKPQLHQCYMGAKVYNQRVNKAIIVTPWSRFTAHPHGHWSVSTARCAFYCGESKLSFVGQHQNGGALGLDRVGPALYDINNFRQAFVDIVSFRLYERQPDGTVLPRDVRASHWELAKEAFDETWQKNDFFCDMVAMDIPAPSGYPAGSILHAIEISDKFTYDNASYLKLWLTKPDALSIYDATTPRYLFHRSPQFLELGRQIEDISSYRWTVNSQMLNGVIGQGSSTSAFVQLTPGPVRAEVYAVWSMLNRNWVLNGSALFVGTVTSEPPRSTP